MRLNLGDASTYCANRHRQRALREALRYQIEACDDRIVRDIELAQN